MPLVSAGVLSLPAYSRVYDPSRNPFVDGRDALKLAQHSGRRVLIEVGGDWCRWCHILERFLLEHAALRSSLHEKFVVLKVNVSEDNDNADFLSAFPKVLGYPHMYITENDGSIVQSQDTAEFLKNGNYSVQHFQAFLERWGVINE